MSARAGRHALASFAVAALVAIGLVAAGGPAPAAAPRHLASAPVAAVTPVAVAASPGVESQFVARVNSLRASQGLSQLSVSGELTGVARRWTDRMVAAGQISHNPSLGSQVSGSWTKLGENVGVGYDVDGLMQAFINSPSHYRNLVDPAWTHIGVGVTVLGDGTIYTTHNFMAMPGGGAPPPPPPPPPPPTTAPPATQPPATTAAPPPTTEPEVTTTTEPPARPEPTPERVAAVLDPLRSLEE